MWPKAVAGIELARSHYDHDHLRRPVRSGAALIGGKCIFPLPPLVSSLIWPPPPDVYLSPWASQRELTTTTTTTLYRFVVCHYVRVGFSPFRSHQHPSRAPVRQVQVDDSAYVLEFVRWKRAKDEKGRLGKS